MNKLSRGAVINLWDEIRGLRARLGLKQQEFANLIGYSQESISNIEKDPRTGGKVASVRIISTIAEKVGRTKEEVSEIRQRLLFARSLATLDPEIASILLSKGSKRLEDRMPAQFIERLRHDLDMLENKEALFSQLKIATKKDVEDALEGKLYLSRKAVTELASMLNQNYDEYLILAEYLPRELREALSRDKARDLLQPLGKLNAEEFDSMLDVLIRFTQSMRPDLFKK